MKLLALVLLLSSFSSLALMAVVDSFKDSCHSLFIQNPEKPYDIITPTEFNGDQYKKICQRWENEYRFATVYNTHRRIPVYSAYTFSEEVKIECSDEWKIEPQLEDITDQTEMIVCPNVTGNIIHQAVNQDYTGSGFTRGHAFPCHFAADQDQADSTFTLTNIAPQTQESNRAWAAQVEEPMLRKIREKCRQNHPVYIVTGAVPGTDWIPIFRVQKIEHGINIPSYYWSAFCCTDKTTDKKLIGKAYLAELQNFHLWQLSIDDLNKRLKNLYGLQEFRVFGYLPIENIESKTVLSSSHSFIQSFINFLSFLSSQIAGELKFSVET